MSVSGTQAILEAIFAAGSKMTTTILAEEAFGSRDAVDAAI
jgi:hypothetical protein